MPLSGISNSDGNSFLSVGGHSNADDIDCVLGELRVYNVSLTHSQVWSIYGEGSSEFV